MTRKLKKSISGRQQRFLIENFVEVLERRPGQMASKEEMLERMDQQLVGGYMNYSEAEVLEKTGAKAVRATNSGTERIVIMPVTEFALQYRDLWDAMSETDIRHCVVGAMVGSAIAGWMIVDVDDKNKCLAWEMWFGYKMKNGYGKMNAAMHQAPKAVKRGVTTPGRAKKRAQEIINSLPRIRTTRNSFLLIETDE